MRSGHYFNFLSVKFSLIYVNRRSEATPLANMIEEKTENSGSRFQSEPGSFCSQYAVLQPHLDWQSECGKRLGRQDHLPR